VAGEKLQIFATFYFCMRLMKRMEEKELIIKIQEGDINAFRILVDNHKNLVWHIVLRMVSRQDDAEDLCQDIFLHIFKNIRSFKGNSKLSTWIGSIAYHVCIDFLRKKGKEKIIYTDQLPEKNKNSAPINPIIGSMDRAHLKTMVHHIVNQLPVQYRTVITLYHLEGCSYKEITEITGMPDGTVKSYISRARDMIREQVIHCIPDIQPVLFDAND